MEVTTTTEPLSTGYSKDIFAQAISLDGDKSYLLCTRKECRNVMKEPIQAKCGHRFCKECFNILKNAPLIEERYCEGCVQEMMDLDQDAITAPDHQLHSIQSDGALKDKAALKEIRALMTICKYSSCGDRMPLFRRQEHIDICQHQPAKCRMCGEKVTKAELINHEVNECLRRMVQCDFGCRSVMRAQDLPEHKANSCPCRQTVCHICHTNIPQGGETDHFTNYCAVDVCPLGCETRITNGLLVDHFSDPANQSLHIRGLVEKCHALKSLIEQQSLSAESEQDVMLATDRLYQMETTVDVVVNRVNHFMNQILTGQSTLTKQAAADNVNLMNGFAKTFHQADVKVEELDVLLQSLAHGVNLMMGFETTFLDIQNKTDQFRTRIDTKMTELEKSLQLREAETVEQKMLYGDLQQSADNGTLVWKIKNVLQEHELAKSGTRHSIFSPPFRSSVYGYRMCLRVYLNGDGQGRSTHLSLFFCVMRGEYDALLPWPFKQKVAMGLCSQVSHTQHIWEKFRPDSSSSSFQRPRTEMNVASGAPKFTTLENILDPNRGYLKDDAIYLIAKVDSAVNDAIHDVGAVINTTTFGTQQTNSAPPSMATKRYC